MKKYILYARKFCIENFITGIVHIGGNVKVWSKFIIGSASIILLIVGGYAYAQTRATEKAVQFLQKLETQLKQDSGVAEILYDSISADATDQIVSFENLRIKTVSSDSFSGTILARAASFDTNDNQIRKAIMQDMVLTRDGVDDELLIDELVLTNLELKRSVNSWPADGSNLSRLQQSLSLFSGESMSIRGMTLKSDANVKLTLAEAKLNNMDHGFIAHLDARDLAVDTSVKESVSGMGVERIEAKNLNLMAFGSISGANILDDVRPPAELNSYNWYVKLPSSGSPTTIDWIGLRGKTGDNRGLVEVSMFMDQMKVPLEVQGSGNPLIDRIFARIGQEKLTFDAKLKIVADVKAGKFTIDPYEIIAVGLGRISQVLSVDEFDPGEADTFSQAGFSYKGMKFTIPHGEFRYDDDILADIVFDSFANGDRETLATVAAQQAQQGLATQMGLGEKVGHAVRDFVIGANFFSMKFKSRVLVDVETIKRHFAEGTITSVLAIDFSGG
jgi:hypothetical protein